MPCIEPNPKLSIPSQTLGSNEPSLPRDDFSVAVATGRNPLPAFCLPTSSGSLFGGAIAPTGASILICMANLPPPHVPSPAHPPAIAKQVPELNGLPCSVMALGPANRTQSYRLVLVAGSYCQPPNTKRPAMLRRAHPTRKFIWTIREPRTPGHLKTVLPTAIRLANACRNRNTIARSAPSAPPYFPPGSGFAPVRLKAHRIVAGSCGHA